MYFSKAGTTVIAITALVGMMGCQTPEMKQQAHADKMQEFVSKIELTAASLPDGYKPMTVEEMTDYVSDTTVSGESTRSPGWFYSIYRSPEGEQRGVSENGSDVSKDNGTWWIENEMFCGRFNRWVDGQMYCGKLYAGDGAVTYVGSDGTVIKQQGYEKGNTKNL